MPTFGGMGFGGGGSISAVASGGTETTYTGNGTNGILGQPYKVHTFTTSGTLTVTRDGQVDILLVGGGGGGNSSYGGGGGAAGMYEVTQQLVSGTYTVQIGQGGAGKGAGIGTASSGTDTRIYGGSNYGPPLSASGGGGGGTNYGGSYPGANGGSGGGGSNGVAAGQAVGTGWGSAGSVGDGSHGGSGGGAGGAPVGFVAGVGRQSSINGTATYFASGGAGEVCSNNASWRGVANSGDGATAGIAGSSGIAIVRYKV